MCRRCDMKELTKMFYNAMMSQVLTIITIASCAGVVLGKASLILPTSANCGNQAVLTCTSTDCNLGYRFVKDAVDINTNTGPQNGGDPARYSATVTSNSQVQLTINNIQFSDSGAYACNCAFDSLAEFQTMNYTCKATTSNATITREKKLSITLEKLYPQPSSVVISLTNPSNPLPGMKTCGPSSLFASNFKCTWLSTESLSDGYHGYTVTVTTGREDVRVTGNFRIVTPTTPTISSLVAISTRHEVLRGIQDTPLTMRCVSRGGIPVPTLAWYRGNTSTYPLEQSNTSDSLQQSDGTYPATLTHTFRPRRADDLTTFLCRVFYPGATIGASPDPSPATALLYIDLKPDNAEVSQSGETVSGESMTLRCSSANGRPAPNITWFYQGQTFTLNNTSSYDPRAETYTVVSILQRPVTANDNGQTATCQVLHTTLPVPLTSNITVDVKFGPSTGSTTIFGNLPTPAIGANQIRLNCTSGSSNPASNITWYNGSDVISSVVANKKSSGDKNGVITSSILTITPTRYMDGDMITCRVNNSYGSDSYYVDLNISYPPLIQPLLNITSTEGEPDVLLTCLASSKPPATFTWSKGDRVMASGTGTLTENSYSYTIPRVDRADAGSYQCEAGNSIGHKDLKNMDLIVKYPPAVTVSITFSLSYIVTCTPKGYPDNYRYLDWVQIWPGYGPVATIPFKGTKLNLTGATYETSGVYVCGASNGVAVYGTDVEFIKGNTTVFIEAPPVLTDPSPDGTTVPVAGGLGQNATIKIKYWSNVDGSVVRCYKRSGDSRSSSSRCSVTETDTKISLPVHNHMVREVGTLAIIKIHISSEEDMTAYDVVVSNGLNRESVRSISIVPQGPPEAPTLIDNFSITPGQVILTVLPGFHGGYNQTLVVQISTDLTTWINKTYIYIGLDIRTTEVILTSLKDNTLHHVRVFAFNSAGRSNNFSTEMNFTTAKDLKARHSSTELIGGTVGTLCALLVLAVVVFVLWRNQKAGWMFSPKADKRSLTKDQANTESVVECAMYVSAENVHPRTSKDDVYSIPQKRRRPDPSANLYDVDSTTKKGVPEIPQVSETTFASTINPPSYSPSRPMKNVNYDGLIYADLEFDSSAKYNVIHGLDDVTIYVEIDFTKTAEPLPDSDEESTEKKKI